MVSWIEKNSRLVIGVTIGLFIIYALHSYHGQTTIVQQGVVDGKVDLRYLLSASVQAAKRGGDVVRTIRESGKLDETSKGKTLEGANDPLTLADTNSHRAIVQTLSNSFPGLHIVSEEHDDVHIDVSPADLSLFSNALPSELVDVEDITVWVDPLDATQEFTEDLTQYVTVMVCIAHKGKPIGAVIHMPFKTADGPARTVVALKHGAIDHLEGVKLAATSYDRAKKIIVSRSHSGAVASVAAKAFATDVEKPVVIPAGGAGYKSVQVLDESVDMYIHVTKIKKWDICAGDAILTAAGGRMTDMHGNTFDYSFNTEPANAYGLLAVKDKTQHAEFLSALEPEFDVLLKSGGH